MSVHNHDPEDFNKRRFEESSNDYVAIARTGSGWFKASDARRMAAGKDDTTQLDKIFPAIKKAANDQQGHIFWYEKLTDYTRSILESGGFKVGKDDWDGKERGYLVRIEW